MYDYAIVKQVKRKPKAMTGILRKVMIIFAVVILLLGVTISQGFMLPGFLLVALYFGYDVYSQKEYEYRLESGRLTIDVILGKRYRKYDYTSYEEDTPYYTMIIMENRTKIKLLLDLDEEMLQTLKRLYPERVFLV